MCTKTRSILLHSFHLITRFSASRIPFNRIPPQSSSSNEFIEHSKEVSKDKVRGIFRWKRYDVVGAMGSNTELHLMFVLFAHVTLSVKRQSVQAQSLLSRRESLSMSNLENPRTCSQGSKNRYLHQKMKEWRFYQHSFGIGLGRDVVVFAWLFGVQWVAVTLLLTQWMHREAVEEKASPLSCGLFWACFWRRKKSNTLVIGRYTKDTAVLTQKHLVPFCPVGCIPYKIVDFHYLGLVLSPKAHPACVRFIFL